MPKRSNRRWFGIAVAVACATVVALPFMAMTVIGFAEGMNASGEKLGYRFSSWPIAAVAGLAALNLGFWLLCFFCGRSIDKAHERREQ